MLTARRSLLAGCVGLVALLTASPAANAAEIGEQMIDLGSGPQLTTRIALAPGENLTMTDDANFVNYALNAGTWGFGPDQTCIPDPPGAATALDCERQTDPQLIDVPADGHAVTNHIDTKPFLLTVVQFGPAVDSYTSTNPGPERILAGDGADTIVDQAGTDVIALGPGADSVQANDGAADSIDCTGGGADTGSFDLGLDTFIACANADGDAVPDMADVCPGVAGSLANGCVAAVAVNPQCAVLRAKLKKANSKKKKKKIRKRLKKLGC